MRAERASPHEAYSAGANVTLVFEKSRTLICKQVKGFHVRNRMGVVERSSARSLVAYLALNLSFDKWKN